MENKYIALGSKATAFYDAGTGLYIADKEIHEVHPAYLKGKRAQNALSGGHLVLKTKDEYEAQNRPAKKVVKEKSLETADESKYADMDENQKKFMMAYDNGATPKQLADMFNRDQLVKLADDTDIEVEAKDNKIDIVNAILQEIEDDEE